MKLHDHIESVLTHTGGYFGEKYIIQAIYKFDTKKTETVKPATLWAVCTMCEAEGIPPFPSPIMETYSSDMDEVIAKYIEMENAAT